MVMMTGGPWHDFDIGWAVLIARNSNRAAGASFPKRAHYYDAGDQDSLRALCGKHIVAVTDALVFYPGNWLRCAHCQKTFDKRWH